MQFLIEFLNATISLSFFHFHDSNSLINNVTIYILTCCLLHPLYPFDIFIGGIKKKEYIKIDRDKSTFKSHRDFDSEIEMTFKHF